MNKIISTVSTAIILFAGLIISPNLDASSLPGIDLPKVTKFDAGGGLAAYRISDEIPMLTITAAIGYGSLYETRENAGAAALLSKTISMAGSEKYPGPALYRAIETLGGRIGFDSSWEQTFITITMLDRHAETAFDILASLVAAPRLGDADVNNARGLIVESLKRQRDEPHFVAFEKLREIIYDGNGYGATPTEKTLASMNAERLRAITSSHFTAGNTTLGITSSLDGRVIETLARKYFGALRKGPRTSYVVDTAALSASLRDKAAKIYIIPRDIPQSTIAVGTLAPRITAGDIIPVSVLNYILGGGSFNSRLMIEIRAKRGLSYSTASVARPRKETGLFLAYAQTRNELAPLTLRLLQENINGMRDNPVTPEEMEWTRKSLENSYIFEFDTPQNILGKYLFLDYNGLDESYLKNYIPRVHAVTPPQIMESGKTLLKDGLVRVVVGKKELAEKLREVGEVDVLK